MIFYGSRARGTALPDSDYDLLVLTPTPLASEAIRRIRYEFYELGFEYGRVMSVLFHSEAEWHDPLWRATPISSGSGTGGHCAMMPEVSVWLAQARIFVEEISQQVEHKLEEDQHDKQP